MIWIVTAAAIVVLASLPSVAGLLFVHRSPRLVRHLGDNDVAGLLFAAVGVLYGALLAFVVFATWEGYSRAEQAVVAEGADLVRSIATRRRSRIRRGPRSRLPFGRMQTR